ncbi:MAG TPA: hypothetical protein VHV30_07715 [Polyangiaceae bacterium]|nr:hypothetical protein [Polyangiaceae bacterium]
MVGLIVVLVAGGTIVAVALASLEARKRAIESIFQQRGAEPVRVADLGLRLGGAAAVEARLGGVLIRYVLQPGGKQTPRKTICEAWLPEASPLEMELRPETERELRNLEQGRAIDLVLGDEAFDDSFVVEAAPSDMARALLDRNARTHLLAFHPCVLSIEGQRLRFTKTSYLEEPAEIARVIDTCADLASRLRALPAQILEQRLAEAHEMEPTGYRGASPAAMRALQTSPRAASELAALHDVRAKRARIRQFVTAAVIVLVVVAWVLVVELAYRR